VRSRAFTLDITNYRSFSAPAVATLNVSAGLIAIVGPNNAGKSNILRLLFELRPLFEIASRKNVSPNLVGLLTSESGLELNRVPDPESIFSNTNDADLKLSITVDDDVDSLPANVPSELTLSIGRNVANNGRRTVTWSVRHGTSQFTSPALHHVGTTQVAPIDVQVIFELEPYRLAFEILANSFYIGSFRNITNQGGNAEYYDLVVGDAFVARWSQAQAGGSVTTARITQTVIQDLETAFGFRRLQILSSDDRKTLRLFVDGHPQSLDELGGGVSQFLITLFNLELKRPALVLLDEPELGLHPQLQLDFLTAIAKRAGFATMFSTHSLGLARAAGDVIYTVTRTGPKGGSILRKFDDINNPVEFIGELSFAGNYDLGYRKILLIEGPTELKLFRRILQRLGAAHKITLIPLGGNSLISRSAVHGLVEIRRLSPQVFAVVDSERTTKSQTAAPDRRSFARNCARLGISCHVLQRRSIESYFTDRAIKAVLGQDYSELDAIEPVPSKWPKALNWKIADAMELDDFRGDDLIKFLKAVVEAS